MASQTKKSKSAKIIEAVETKEKRSRSSRVHLPMVKLVIFTLLNDYFAFTAENIKEILPGGKINYVPGVPDFILGIINVRGDIESVIDINHILGMAPLDPTKQNHIIIGEAEGIRSGILVGSVEDVMDFTQESIKPPLATLNETIKQFVKGSNEYMNYNVTVLDINEIFKKISVD